jgi:hypothetical protein
MPLKRARWKAGLSLFHALEEADSQPKKPIPACGKSPEKPHKTPKNPKPNPPKARFTPQQEQTPLPLEHQCKSILGSSKSTVPAPF